MWSTDDKWWEYDPEGVDVLNEISDQPLEHKYTYIINTDKLKAFIDKYGVDYNGRLGTYLLGYLEKMTLEQIDIVFQYRPDCSKIIEDTQYYGYLFGKYTVYIMHKFLEQDTQFLFIQKKLCLYDSSMRYWQSYTFSELAKLDKQHFGMNDKTFLIIQAMIKNHEKKYYSLFDLLKQKLLK